MSFSASFTVKTLPDDTAFPSIITAGVIVIPQKCAEIISVPVLKKFRFNAIF